MDFVACIKQIVKNRGVEEIAKRSFIGLLEDYQAFEKEAQSSKLVLKRWSESGRLGKVSKMSAKNSQWIIDASDIIHQTEAEGFKKEVVSELLHKLLLGIGIVDSKFDWNKEFLSKNASTSSETKMKIKLSNVSMGKSILRYWEGNNIWFRINNISTSRQWKQEVIDILQQTEAKGYDRAIASEMIRQILVSKCVIDSLYDWNKEFLSKNVVTPVYSNQQSNHKPIVETQTEETLNQKEIDKEWQKIQKQQQRDKKKAERVAKRAQSKKEKEKKKAILKSALKKKENGYRLDDSEKQAYVAYMKNKETVSDKWMWITFGMLLLLLVSVIVYCYCLIVGSSSAPIWGVISLVCIGGGVTSLICVGIFSDELGGSFVMIAGVMACLFIVGLIVILWGWILGSGHKPIWNILTLVGLCAGLVCFIVGTALDGLD